MSENSKTLSQRTLKEFTPPIVLRLARKLLYGKPNREVRGQEQGPEYYDQTFLNREHWRQHYTQSPYYPLWAVIADRIARSEPTSVLDIGCGPGQFAALLQDKGLPQYLGIDFSPKRIKQAREVCPEFDFVIADVFETDLLSAYDTVQKVQEKSLT